MVRTTPAICNLGLSLFLILSTVLAIAPMPSSARNSVCKRHQHGVDRDQGVQGHQAERGRTVDQDDGPALAGVAAGGVQRVFQAMLAALHVDELDLGAGERHRGRHHRQAGDLRGAHAIGQRRQAQQEFIGSG